MSILNIILIILIIAGILGIVYAVSYNKLTYYKTRIERSENIIDDALRQKYDKLCLLDIEIKKVITNKDYLKEYINLKDQKISNYDMDRKLIEAYNLVQELIYDNKKLDNKDVNTILKDVKDIDENLASGRNFYNKNTTELNDAIRKFPSSIPAHVHNYKIKPYFDGKNMQDAIIDDFKL
jgi:LemA protein